MMISQASAVAVMVVFLALGVASFDGSLTTGHHQKRSVEQPVQLCGHRLLNAVQGLCNGVILSRRSDPGFSLAPLYEEIEIPMSNSLEDANMPQYMSDDAGMDDAEVPFPSWNNKPNKLLALKILAEAKGHPRFRRSIIDDCCKRPCTMQHMLKYCGRSA